MLTSIRPRGQARSSLRSRARNTMNTLFAWQLGAASAGVAVLMVWPGPAVAYSALVGAIIAIVPNYYLASRLLRRRTSATPDEAWRGIYTGELLKIAFTMALFVIAIRVLDIVFLIVVAAYLAMVAVNGCALLFIDLGEAPQSPTTGADSK